MTKGLVWIKPAERRKWLQALLEKRPSVRAAIVDTLANRLVTISMWCPDERIALERWRERGGPEEQERCKFVSSYLAARSMVYAVTSSPPEEAAKLASNAFGLLVELARDREREQVEQQAELKRRIRGEPLRDLQDAPRHDPRG